ncbi:MAG: siroheme synthase CysG, partial [Woeseiaceae bacterium]|nr:siroheme synthase CysG [Woeseiaceae bacterium]
MDYLPVFMDLRGREALIVGGGVVASRKAALVAKAGACLTIVSAALSPAMRTLLRDERHRWIARNFDDSDVAAADLVIAATDDGDINRRVYEAASRWRIPVNVVDAPAQCSFILPAIVDRSPAIIAVSTGGRSPVLARHVKALLERLLPARLGRLAAFCGRLRRRVAAAVPEPAARRRFWESQLEGHVPELVYAGRSRDAEAAIAAELEACDADRAPRGEVYLIGAGPGDPELLTLKAQRLLQRADVVLYDRLVPVGVLEMCRREAEAVYVGKRCGDHPVPQQEISAMLVDYAQQGKRVARLKGGDPFVFGRGGEELEALAEAGIDF